jgi:hypothetical protein
MILKMKSRSDDVCCYQEQALWWDGKGAGPWIELKKLGVNGWLFASIF